MILALPMKRVRRALAYAALGFVVPVMVFPLLWMILASCKTEQEIFVYPPTLLPKQFTLFGAYEKWPTSAFQN